MAADRRTIIAVAVALAFAVTLAIVIGTRLESAVAQAIGLGAAVGAVAGAATGTGLALFILRRARSRGDGGGAGWLPDEAQGGIILTDEQAEALFNLLEGQVEPGAFPLRRSRERKVTAVGGAILPDEE